MKKKVVFILFLLLNGIMALPLCSQRVRVCFDEGWQFHLGDIALKQAVKAGQQGGLTDTGAPRVEGEETKIAYTDRNKTIPYKAADWTDVDIPHDWLVDVAPEEDYTIGSQGAGNGFHRLGIGCYRKEFLLDEQCRGKRLTLEFDGIFRASTIWVNGHLMGHHESGYTPSFYDISEVARYGSEGENVVFVKVDATEYEGWWYEGCGIYRHTWLTITDNLHVARFGTFITTPDVSEQSAKVTVEATIKNESDRLRRFKVINTIEDKDGTVLQRMETDCEAKGGEKLVVSQNSIVNNPKLWSPETPSLYKMNTSLVEDGKAVDDVVTTFGIRSVEMRGDGFYLNGKIYPVKGRAHHSPTPELLDACDSLGMLVLDENRLLWVSDEGMDDLRTLNGSEVRTTADLPPNDTITKLTVFRNQKKKEINI